MPSTPHLGLCSGNEPFVSPSVEDDPFVDTPLPTQLHFDKISDLFRCKREDFGRPVPGPAVAADPHMGGPRLEFRPPHCSCCDKDGSPYTAKDLLPDTDQRFNQSEPWQTLTFRFKNNVLGSMDESGEIGRLWTKLRYRLTKSKSEAEALYLVTYPDDSRRADLFLRTYIPIHQLIPEMRLISCFEG